MCGITGYIGFRKAKPVLLQALAKLEYRGYDSAGIAVLHEGMVQVRKMKGPLKALATRLATEPIEGAIGIGHTRWATHGEPSDVNSHPHTDVSGRIAVVHNGIIENYAALKAWLCDRGGIFISETDTEVVAHLINYYYQNVPQGPWEDRLLYAVRRALSRITGSYALAVISADVPDRLIAARKDSPLIVGLGEGEQFIASDVPALLAYTREVYFLEEGEVAVVYRDTVELFTEQGEPVDRTPTHIDWDLAAAEKGGYAHFMLKEIHDQPKAYTDTLRSRLVREGQDWAVKVEEIPLDHTWAAAPRIVLTACGTAWHAAMVGKYAFERFARIPVEVDIASEYRYRNPVFNPQDIFIVISQSGETADTLAAMRLAKKGGARIVAITNAVGSTLSREADQVMYTWAGPEIAVASTKAFTTQLMCLYLLALKLGTLRGCLRDANPYLQSLTEAADKTAVLLRRKEQIQRFAARQFNKNKVFFMGRQFDYAVSLEGALKLKEISYTHSEAFAAGELKHGPIALVDTHTLVVALATQGELFDKIASNIREVTARGAATAVITWEGEGEAAFHEVAQEVFTLPRIEDSLSPLLSVIPAQLFAYYCAVQRGNDPDKPRNLAKSVTVE
ncbi:MAG: glutamine--fructose-6-phosphate transaminase (isomerizing) [Spirochaetaceae bacterium]|jgi:glucosamine--fructose-6-phosphate aminotransferase (isomerizing)|nr:glutamine--fructose-6-phosphate transaminase (isomerizing) [Spirochaetaceae bacterium]